MPGETKAEMTSSRKNEMFRRQLFQQQVECTGTGCVETGAQVRNDLGFFSCHSQACKRVCFSLN